LLSSPSSVCLNQKPANNSLAAPCPALQCLYNAASRTIYRGAEDVRNRELQEHVQHRARRVPPSPPPTKRSGSQHVRAPRRIARLFKDKDKSVDDLNTYVVEFLAAEEAAVLTRDVMDRALRQYRGTSESSTQRQKRQTLSHLSSSPSGSNMEDFTASASKRRKTNTTFLSSPAARPRAPRHSVRLS